MSGIIMSVEATINGLTHQLSQRSGYGWTAAPTAPTFTLTFPSQGAYIKSAKPEIAFS